jgi:hypothetical protein
MALQSSATPRSYRIDMPEDAKKRPVHQTQKDSMLPENPKRAFEDSYASARHNENPDPKQREA